MYWHFFPAVTCMQIWGGKPSLNLCKCSVNFCERTETCAAQTSNWEGMGFLVGRGLTGVHFFLSCEVTSTTLRSLAQLRQTEQKVYDHRVSLTSSVFLFVSVFVSLHSRVSGLGGAVLLVFVGFAQLTVSPALTTNKHHLQGWRTEPSLHRRQLRKKTQQLITKDFSA